MAVFAPAIFVGAFLLFLVQPLLGKYILPWFGGGPGVWTTCLLFFQAMLLAGYAYSHLISTRFKVRHQVLIHLVMIAISLALLPAVPADSWKPMDGRQPTLRILLLLGSCVGLPYLVLSATGPLLQRWFGYTCPGTSPYRLYALSNLGSLLALVSYPTWFEMHYTRRAQGILWAGSFVVFALFSALTALRTWRAVANLRAVAPQQAVATEYLRPFVGQRILWVLFPACASVLLLAATNKLCQDVAVIPFLWVLPLGVYLLSFILCFDSPKWYARVPFAVALVGALAALTWSLYHSTDIPVRAHITVYALGLFVCSMVCHGELYRLRSPVPHLIGFYLAIAAGGALGGLFVAALAPWLFDTFYEMHFGILLCAILFLLVSVRDWRPAEAATGPDSSPWNGWRWLGCLFPVLAFIGLDWFMARLGDRYPHVPRSWFTSMRVAMWFLLVFFASSWFLRGRHRAFRHWRLLTCLWLAAGTAALAIVLVNHALTADPDMVFRFRNFYGSLTVYEHRRNDPEGAYRLLQHGGTTHGLQLLAAPRANWPTTYYGHESGVGKAFRALPTRDRRIGLVGLGVGTLAAYASNGDTLRIYEINPAVIRLATNRFGYLARCQAEWEIIPGDARLAMECEPAQGYDLLALDAFSSDAIPVHLLTREAFAVYLRHLASEGILAIHISNHYLDLAPVVGRLAREFRLHLRTVDYEENNEEWWLYASSWILLSRSRTVLDNSALGVPIDQLPRHQHSTFGPLWTDDFTSLYQVLKK